MDDGRGVGAVDAGRQPFYFFMVFWGAEHRGYFTDLCLASLLAPGNLPSLDPERRSRFLICTTRVDWEALQAHPLFQKMRAYVEPVWIEMQSPARADLKMLVMSKGHKEMSSLAHRDGALGLFLTADMIIADGMVRRLQELALQGRRVVLVAAMRYAYEGFIEEASARDIYKPGTPFVLQPRQLAGLAVRHLHSETRHYDFDAPWFGNYMPVCPLWRVPGESGILLHGFSWAAMMVSYAHLPTHDTETFENWTVDGDYVYRNFPNPDDVYVVTDSDEMMLVGLTRESDISYECVPDPVLQLPVVGYQTRIQIIAKMQHGSFMDPLKRHIFELPVRIHEHDVTPAWKKVERRARRVVKKTRRAPSVARLRKVERRRDAIYRYEEIRFNRALSSGEAPEEIAARSAGRQTLETKMLVLVAALGADAIYRYTMLMRVVGQLVGLMPLMLARYRRDLWRAVPGLRWLMPVIAQLIIYTPLFLIRRLNIQR